MNSDDKEGQTSLGTLLSQAIGSDSLEFVVSTADILYDKFASSDALDGVPVIGLISTGLKSVREVRDHLFQKKLEDFLKSLEETTKEERARFVSRLEKDGQTEYFGETILLIIDRIDDAKKSTIVGQILAAHILGKIKSYDETMRLISIVSRAYTSDLSYLVSFQPGLQKDHDVAASLSAAGLLAVTGIDGGKFDSGSGGYAYDLNAYGRLFVMHGLK